MKFDVRGKTGGKVLLGLMAGSKECGAASETIRAFAGTSIHWTDLRSGSLHGLRSRVIGRANWPTEPSLTTACFCPVRSSVSKTISQPMSRICICRERTGAPSIAAGYRK
jgi:hypothetical protein